MKVKYDKKLNKYHIEFNTKNEYDEKMQVYKKLAEKYSIEFSFDTQIDGKEASIREENVAFLTSHLDSLDIAYNITHREVESTRRFFGIPTFTKVRDTHYVIKAIIESKKMTNELIDFFIRHEIHLRFKDEELYNSAIFCKILSSIDLSQI